MAKKRRLSDLYVVGKEFEVDDGSGDPIKIWMKKLNQIDTETALRRANAARARVLAGHEENQDLVDAAYGETLELEHEDCVELLVNEDVGRRAPVIEAQVEAEEKWSEHNYLQGLKDAWGEEMEERWVTDSEDPDAKAVFEALNTFAEEVEEELKSYSEQCRSDWASKDIETLRQELAKRRLNGRGDAAWVQEFRRCEVWLGTYEPDKHTRYFPNRHEVDQLQIEVFLTLTQLYQSLAVDPMEGKGSRATGDSSSSSEQPDSPATEEPSGLEDAPA